LQNIKKGDCEKMKVTAKVSKLNGDGKVKAIASIVIEDAFKVDNIRVVEGEKGLFVSMPQRKTESKGYVDIAYPITKEARELVNKVVLDAYNALS